MRIFPAVHYTMGGLWVDYNLMSNIPGLHVLGEANFSDHGANRLGASALMQGLADGYFVIPYTLGHYLAGTELPSVTVEHPAFRQVESEAKDKLTRLLSIKGEKTPQEFHRQIGQILWDYVGMSRNAEGLLLAKKDISQIRDEFWQNVNVVGSQDTMNKNLEFAGRIADYLELAELMAIDARDRAESCGGHFREESQTPEGEALRDDENYSYTSAWERIEVQGDINWSLHKEPLVFENVELTQRSYK